MILIIPGNMEKSNFFILCTLLFFADVEQTFAQPDRQIKSLNDCLRNDYLVDSLSYNEFFMSEWHQFKEDLSDGHWCFFYDSSSQKLAAEIIIQNGEPNEESYQYYPNQILRYYCQYLDGDIDGISVLYGPEGQLWRISEFQRGEKRRSYLFENNKIASVIEYFGKEPGTKIYKRPRKIPDEYLYLLKMNE